MSFQAQRRYLSLAEAAEVIGVCQQTVRRRIADGDLKAVRVGPRTIRVLLDDLESLGTPIQADGGDGDV